MPPEAIIKGEAPSEDANDRADEMNAAIKSHLRRELRQLTAELAPLKNLEQLISAAVEKRFEGQAPASAPAKAGKDDGKALDPQIKLLQEQVEKLTKQSADDRAARQQVEERSRRDGARAQVREALEQKGIKGARAQALISHMEVSGALHFDEEGKPALTVSRARSKGAPSEPLIFDLAQGVEDWVKTPEAADFLPAPGKAQQQAQQAPQRAGQRAPVQYERPAMSDQEAVQRTIQQLEAQGINVNAILNE